MLNFINSSLFLNLMKNLIEIFFITVYIHVLICKLKFQQGSYFDILTRSLSSLKFCFAPTDVTLYILLGNNVLQSIVLIKTLKLCIIAKICYTISKLNILYFPFANFSQNPVIRSTSFFFLTKRIGIVNTKFILTCSSKVNRWQIPAGRIIKSLGTTSIRIHRSALSRTSKYPLPSVTQRISSSVCRCSSKKVFS